MVLFSHKKTGSALMNGSDDDGELNEIVDAQPRLKPQASSRSVPDIAPVTPRAISEPVDIDKSNESEREKGSTTVPSIDNDESTVGSRSAAKKGYAEVKQHALEKLNTNNGNADARSRERRRSEDYGAEEVSDASGDTEDLEPVEVLLQFIPFYGQGDPANDSIVRSTLSGLSVEDIDSKDEYGNTLLLLACQYKCEDLVRIMLNKGADPNALNSSGACGLHFACYRDSASLNIVKILLKNGANPDVAETSYGCTPLHYSASNGDIEFCKLLLSYGAQINTVDFYNYTCVDYARDAGFDDLVEFLQKRLDKFNAQNQARNGALLPTKSFLGAVSPYIDMSEWESFVDPGSGVKYYRNIKTDEYLWESELKERALQQQQRQSQPLSVRPLSARPLTAKRSAQSLPTPTVTFKDEKDQEKEKALNETLVAHALQSFLISFFTRNDPARLVDVEKLTEQYKGKEKQLFKDLRAQYKVEADEKEIAFEKKLEELRGSSSVSRVSSFVRQKTARFEEQVDTKETDPANIDPLLLQDLAQDVRKKLEVEFEEEKTAIRKKLETQLDEERHGYQKTISEKEGLNVKLETELETLKIAKTASEKEIADLNHKISALQASGGEAVLQSDKELQRLKDTNASLREQVALLQQEISVERDKLAGLEGTLANLTSGQEEMIARERAAAEDRAEKMRQRELEFANEMKELENKAKSVELKLKSDLKQSKIEANRVEKQLKEEFDIMKRSKEQEIEDLRRELAERKAQFAQELSAANMDIVNARRSMEEAMKRAAEAEEAQRSMQNEIDEARIIQKFNAQLHKDILREQLARKKLHNDMEDLKGKIRVYVRIRPFSNSERERGCLEAVTKEGKMSVCVKGVGGPDQKKFYDFDSIFGGNEGNTQTDVFKDTKHLIMSVIDGYNVCIFAYGQTGAGKSYTMIGGSDIGTSMAENGEFDESAGITPRAISELFRLLNERTAQVEYVVEVQMFQLYRDALEDLLKEKRRKRKDDEDMKDKDPPLKITLAEHSPTGLVFVDGAETMVATTPSDVIKILSKGSSRRTTASTQMNAESSRSHLICSLVVKLTNRRSGVQSVGKLTLVDLAGSERVDKSGATGEQLKEAQSINKSLSALGDVIAALTTNQQHIPYRNHPLTMLMSDSIGGNAKTLMFVNTSPADYNANESNNSLAFANRCKDITNMVSAGPGVQAAQMNALKKELAKLKKAGGSSSMKPMMAQTLARPDTSAGGRSQK